MSALIIVQIICNADGCANAYNPSITAVSDVKQARSEAHDHGWTSIGPLFGDDRVDFCPQHVPAGGDA